MTLKELREKKAALQAESRTLLAKPDDQLTAEEVSRLSAIDAELSALATSIDRAELLERRRKDAESLATAPINRQTAPDPIDTLRIEPVAPEKFKSLGEQLQAIAGAALSGREDNRLVWDSLAPATGSAQAGVPSDGGYLIQKDFSLALLNRMNEMGQIKSRVNVVTIGPNSDGLKLPVIDETSRATGSRWGGVQVYWGSENDAATAKKPKTRLMELELKDLIGLAYASNRLLQDASAMESVFMQAFSEEMNFMIEDGLFNGDGAGKPLGILQSPALVSVAKETGQAAATIVYENINKMWARLWSRSWANAVWFINQDCLPQLDNMVVNTASGNYPAYLPPGGVADQPFGRLKGRPVIPVEYAATLGTVGDIVLADFSQVLGIEKGGMSADQSIHVRFTTNENTFRFIYRYDAQPLWNSALTPFKGSNTQSPFIALATRS